MTNDELLNLIVEGIQERKRKKHHTCGLDRT